VSSGFEKHNGNRSFIDFYLGAKRCRSKELTKHYFFKEELLLPAWHPAWLILSSHSGPFRLCLSSVHFTWRMTGPAMWRLGKTKNVSELFDTTTRT
jgi:hypothetical protein